MLERILQKATEVADEGLTYNDNVPLHIATALINEAYAAGRIETVTISTRDHFAGLAMQSLITVYRVTSPEYIAEQSAIIAKELIKQLNK
jgi:hypothetical protein